MLAERGIAAALEAQARVAALPVRVEPDGVDRQPIETEAAVYFCCLEAVQNAAKYAQASEVTVRLGQDGRRISRSRSATTEWDSTLGDRPAGSGLQGMADRLAALGGVVEVARLPAAAPW